MAKKKDYHHGDLRNALLAAAREELIEKGPEKFSLRGCAKRAGVSHAAPAHHFKDTEALLQAVAADGFAQLTAELQALQQESWCEAPLRLRQRALGLDRHADGWSSCRNRRGVACNPSTAGARALSGNDHHCIRICR